MTRYFRFYCKDVSSDLGYVEIIVRTDSMVVAWGIVRRELITKGRPELMNQLYCDMILESPDGVIFSSVECYYEPSVVSAHRSSSPGSTGVHNPSQASVEAGFDSNPTGQPDLRPGDVGSGGEG